jgi:SAM-dependent MidA family methyltransferase
MSALKSRILEQIARDGPLSVAAYMTTCLLHPTHGYYMRQNPLGARGDFVTAPEISQMFGELIGLWLAQTWLEQGSPARFILAEAGPGRGTLMADILRATQGVPGFHDAMHLHLVEASPTLRETQAKALAAQAPRFCGHVADLPDGPLFLIANEFFDALPIRQFLRGKTFWSERQIGADGDRLIWGLAPEAAFPPLDHRLAGTEPGQIVEHCAPGEAIAGEIGHRIDRFGGAALIIDYGADHSIGDTFQALQAHRYIDPLAAPGDADLTAHVAFDPLARAAHPARASALVPQGVFLERLGITARAQALARGLRGEARETHIAAHKRLTHPKEMGHLFKVLALTPERAPPPPALEPHSAP